MSVKLRRTAVSGGRGVGALALVGVGLLLLTAVGCSAPSSTNATASPSTYLTVVLRIQQIGPVGTTPSQAKQVASAVDCRFAYAKSPVPAGTTYLVRLKVSRGQLNSSLAALEKLHDVSDIHAEDESSFSATPSDISPEGTKTC